MAALSPVDKRACKAQTMILRLTLFLALITQTYSLDWFVCPKNATKASIVKFNESQSIGLRSYDWPNSIRTYGSNLLRFGNCRMQFQSTANQRLVATFLNARATIYENDSEFYTKIDTNHRTEVPSYSSPGTVLKFQSLNTSKVFDKQRWSGFEAIITAFDNERVQCPFETKNGPVEIDENSPQYISSHYDLKPHNFVHLPSLNCSWYFKAKPGYVLKMVLNMFTLKDGREHLKIWFDAAENGIDIRGGTVANSAPLYAKESFKIDYNRVDRSSDNGLFVGVISTYPEEPRTETNQFCSDHNAMTLTDISKATYIGNNLDPMTVDYLKPYANKQRCSWVLSVPEGKEARLHPYHSDFEQFCDKAFLNTNLSNLDLAMADAEDTNKVFVIRPQNPATVYSQTDGNFGRSGFAMSATVLDCSCGSETITLSKDNPEMVFGPSGQTKNPYCSNMKCGWTVTPPINSILVLTTNGGLRGCGPDSHLGYGDKLQILDIGGKGDFVTTDCDVKIPANFYIFTVSAKVSFSSSDQVPLYYYEDTPLSFTASYIDYSVLANTPQTINDTNDFVIFDSSVLTKKYASQTYLLGSHLKDTNFNIYTLDNTADPDSNLLIIDGELNANATSVDLFRLHRSAIRGRHCSMNSQTGRITIVRLGDKFKNSTKLLIKLYDVSRECSVSTPLYIASPTVQKSSFKDQNDHQGSDYCAMFIYVPDQPFAYPAMDLLNGIAKSDKPVKVVAGLDIHRPSLYEFDTKTVEDWNIPPVVVYGSLFMIRSPRKGDYSFDLWQAKVKYGYVVQQRKSQTINGVFMSPNYPFGGGNKSIITESLTLQGFPEDNGKRDKIIIDLEVFIEDLSAAIAVEVYEGVNLVKSYTKASPRQNTYKTKAVTEVTLKYTGMLEDKGFFMRYHVEPVTDGAELFGLSLIAIATVVGRFWI
ncbi:hypothetical protein L596_026890 [Steinernema carpocapsae]|uniref:CUB domain-containing protein n=1 Tax=Steinernema carpocapsae TaxID=34508 RepID=A0A4U5M2P3_STECR|nr:hypothetical protein L596_026890 [Steinernema carpocapsae]